MIFFPSDDAPFGFLEPFHAYAIANTRQITWSNCYKLVVIPLLPLYFQALLLRKEGTRRERIALAVLGLGLLWRAAFKYRFLQPWFNALNNGLGIGYMTMSFRYVEFALINGKMLDPYWEDRGRHWLVSALDTSVNARWIGLGTVDLDTWRVVKDSGDHSGEATKKDGQMPDGGVETHGKTVPKGRTYPPWVSKPPAKLSRYASVWRHFKIAFRGYVVSDVLLALLREFGSDTIGSNRPVPNALSRFSHENIFIVFPKLFGGFRAPWWTVELVSVISVAVCVWLGLSISYHALAAVAIGSGLYETEAWEADLFDNPLNSDSLLDFWGRRWHQFFRHQFTLASSLLLRTLNLPVTSPSILALSFFFSGAMHALGQYLMDPVPALLPIFMLFPLSGLGCALEVMFKRQTGRKVRGLWGRVWAWAWMLTTGRWAAIAWFESGVGGSYLTPALMGEIMKSWLLENVIKKL
ncbi:hypothetical protein L204_100840 [Cryptococcus depauperatus]